jgi:hypothetical protein
MGEGEEGGGVERECNEGHSIGGVGGTTWQITIN